MNLHKENQKIQWKILTPNTEVTRLRALLGVSQTYYSKTKSGLLTSAKMRQLQTVGIHPTKTHYHKGLVSTVLYTKGLNLDLSAIDAHIRTTDSAEINNLHIEASILQYLAFNKQGVSTKEALKERNKRLCVIAKVALPSYVWEELRSTKTFMKNTAPYVGLYKASLNESK